MVKGVEQLMAESELTSSHPSFKQWPLPRLLLTLFLLLLRVNSGVICTRHWAGILCVRHF